MNFLKKFFSKTPKNVVKSHSSTVLSEGDIFYTYSERQFHIYKLLRIDDDLDAFHVLNYKSLDQLPDVQKIDELEVQVYHLPIDKNGFSDITILAKTILTEDDLIGYHEYLRQTQGDVEIAVNANKYFKEAYDLTDEQMLDEAIEKYSMAVDLVPDFFEAIDNRAFCKMDLGRWNDAIEDFLLSLKVNPGSTLAEFSIGECYLRLGDNKKAKEQFEKALIIDSTHQPSLFFLKKVNELLSSSS